MDSKRKKVKRSKYDEISPNFDIPGVKRVYIYPETQKSLSCRVGSDLSDENPWKYLSKNDLTNNLKTFENSSEFLSIKNEILTYDGTEILVGYIPKNNNEDDEFYVCVTTEAEKIISNTIDQLRKRQQEIINNSIEKMPRRWKSQGSEAYVDLLIEKNNRRLLMMEVETDYPVKAEPARLKLRYVEEVRDGYVEFVAGRLIYDNVILRRIDNFVQAIPTVTTSEAQTTFRYPKNNWTQTEVKSVVEELDEERLAEIDAVVDANVEEVCEKLLVNSSINFYTSDYSDLVRDERFTTVKEVKTLQEYSSLFDIGFRSQGLAISSASWHPMWTETVAVSYSSEASSCYRTSKLDIDEANRAVYELFPILLWSFQDKLRPKLYLETPREVSFISFCPYDENLLVGGCINGQIIIWDLINKLGNVEEAALTQRQQKFRKRVRAMVGWMKVGTQTEFVRPTVVSNLELSHGSAVTSIKWLSPYREITKTGQIAEIEDVENRHSLTFLSASRDGSVLVWDLTTESPIETDPKPLRLLTKRPPGLIAQESHLKPLNRIFSPIYKLDIKTSRHLPISSLSFRNTLPSYIETKPTSRSKLAGLNDQVMHKPVFNKPTHPVTPKLVLGTTEGDFLMAEWEGLEFDPEDLLNKETTKITSIARFHDGPVVSVTRSQNIPDLYLTVGGTVFALWKEGYPNKPVMWKRSHVRYSYGTWNVHRPSMFRLTRADGCLEIWVLDQRTDRYLTIEKLSPKGLAGTYIHPVKTKENVVAIADSNCALRLFSFAENVHSFEEESRATSKIFEREMRRKEMLAKWQEAWTAKHVPPKVEEKSVRKPPRRPPRDTSHQALKKTKEWKLQQKKLEEKERLTQVLLQKKGLEVDLLNKLQIPLVEKKMEEQQLGEKQKAGLKQAEQLYAKAVAIEFPDVLEKRIPPTPDPYICFEAPEAMIGHYQDYQKIQNDCDVYVSEHSFEYDFKWLKILSDGKTVRNGLDRGYYSAKHRFRMQVNRRKEPNPALLASVPVQVPVPVPEATAAPTPAEIVSVLKRVKKKRKSAKPSAKKASSVAQEGASE